MEYDGYITLASVVNGSDGSTYSIKTNYQIAQRIYDVDEGYVQNTYTISPEQLLFQVYNQASATPGNPLIPGQDYNYDIGLCLDGINYTYVRQTYSASSTVIGITGTATVFFDLEAFINECKTHAGVPDYDAAVEYCENDQGNVFFTFEVYPLNNHSTVLIRSLFTLQNYVGSSIAKFNQTADSIIQAVNNSTMTFSADGLEIRNGGFKILSSGYRPITAEERSAGVKPGVDYYIQDSQGQYNVVQISEFADGVIYYILETDEDVLLEYTPGDTLYVKGNGEFTGNIYADNGYFHGEIEAASGTIGGWIITDEELYSTATKSGSSTSSAADAKIRLKGEEGAIYAYDLTLGDAATIEHKITLGSDQYMETQDTEFITGKTYYEEHEGVYTPTEDTSKQDGKIYYEYQDNRVYLYNPDYALTEEGLSYFYKVNNNVYLTSDGRFNLNGIVLDGATATIAGSGGEGGNARSNYGWPDFFIRPDKAYFPNVEVAGKISTAVFEQDHVQSVGGVMLFKPSFKIERTIQDSTTSTTVKFLIDGDITQFVNDGQYISIIDGNGAPVFWKDEDDIYKFAWQISNYGTPSEEDFPGVDDFSNKSFISIEQFFDAGTTTVPNYQSIIVLGKEGDVIIGVNSTDSVVNWLKPRGLTIATFNPDTNIESTRVFLGDLSEARITGVNAGDLKYGLYSDNVILTGALTTRNIDEQEVATYAGVNTLSNIASTKFPAPTFNPPDISNIIFWAGAMGVDSISIQEAPFQVTRDGSIYARNGLFEGVIISRSTIKGVDIYAARIHGAAKDTSLVQQAEEYGLAFYDCNNAIVFKAGGETDDDAQTVFAIGTNGFKLTPIINNNDYFIHIENSVVNFRGHDISATNTIKGEELIATTDNNNPDANQIRLGYDNSLQLAHYTNDVLGHYFDLSNTNGQFVLGNNNLELFLLDGTLTDQSRAEFKSSIFKIAKDFQLGTTMEYRYVQATGDNHYDLYIQGDN